VNRLESRLGSHSELHSRVNKLEASMAPDPEQERLISRISAKLDTLERGAKLGSEFRPTARQGGGDDSLLGAEMHHDREERINYLQGRIERLKTLRTKYEQEEGMP
jgi:hypothetical protein